MATPTTSIIRNEPGALERWIDDGLAKGSNVLDLVGELVRTALPAYEGPVSPALFGNEGWYWPWNRLGFGLINAGRPREGAVVNSVAYLASLRYQNDCQERLHKGLPLNNVAYAYNRASDARSATVPAALAMIEDAITAANPTETVAIKNLLAAGYPRLLAESLASHALVVYRGQGRSPLFPETVLDSFVQERFLASTEIIEEVKQLAAVFSAENIESSLQRLNALWERYFLMMPTLSVRGPKVYGRANGSVGSRAHPPTTASAPSSTSQPPRPA